MAISCCGSKESPPVSGLTGCRSGQLTFWHDEQTRPVRRGPDAQCQRDHREGGPLVRRDRAAQHPEVIVVDDGLDQATRSSGCWPLTDRRCRSSRTGCQRGCRYRAQPRLCRAQGRYVLFFDADDQIHPGALLNAVEALDDLGADAAIMRLSLPSRSGTQVRRHELLRHRCVEPVRRRATSDCPAGRSAGLLGFSNYPWNKLVRNDHYRRYRASLR